MRPHHPVAFVPSGGAGLDRLSDYDYELPPERIAQSPLADRAASKLLWLHRGSGEIEHRSFRDVLEILRPGDLLVANDTRVSAVRLIGRKVTGAVVELLLLRPVGPGRFEALAKPGRRLQPGTKVRLEGGLAATIQKNLPDGRKLVRLSPPAGLEERLAQAGRTPLPPYITEELLDPERYQTVYASVPGSAAAPTAGLHFTDELLEALRDRGIEVATVTLDVGLDTFRPVEAEDLDQHRMHGERCRVPEAAAAAISRCAGRIVAVGTTVVRTLESMADGPRRVRAGEASTRLFIRPGFRFQIVDGMFTNFHLPRTTMLMMVAALAGGENIERAYREALDHGYRFLSFGDSMLIL